MPTQRWKRSNEKQMNDKLKDCHHHVSTTSHLQFLRSCTHPSLHPKPSFFQASKRHLRLVEEAYKILAWPYSSCLQEYKKFWRWNLMAPMKEMYAQNLSTKWILHLWHFMSQGSLGWNRSQNMVDVKTCTCNIHTWNAHNANIIPSWFSYLACFWFLVASMQICLFSPISLPSWSEVIATGTATVFAFFLGLSSEPQLPKVSWRVLVGKLKGNISIFKNMRFSYQHEGDLRDLWRRIKKISQGVRTLYIHEGRWRKCIILFEIKSKHLRNDFRT